MASIPHTAAVLAAAALAAGCVTQGGALCAPAPAMVIGLQGGGSEDLAVLPLDAAGTTTRLFLREICDGTDAPRCRPGQWRVGSVDVGKENVPASTRHAWRPEGKEGEHTFEPLGMSLVPDDAPGAATLFIADIGRRAAVRIWQLRIEGGEVVDARLAAPADADAGSRLAGANSLQPVRDGSGFRLYVTRFDEYGLLPWRPTPWPALVQVRDGRLLEPANQDFRNANGIIDACPGCNHLVVASYWERRLRFASKNSGEIGGYASAELPIRPDNLRLDGERILIGGQHRVDLTALNLLVSSRIPSPSAVYAVDARSLGPDAVPTLLWEGGWRQGHSVTTAVALPNERLAIGQINTPTILVVDCSARP